MTMHMAIPAAPRVRPLGVCALLEWAFAAECAQLDFDEVGSSSGGQRRGVSMEAVLMERAILGGVRIDTSVGCSVPADDAEIIASIVSALPVACGGRPMAIRVAELARAARTPDWMDGAAPRVEPARWRKSPSGYRAAQAEGDAWTYRSRRGWVTVHAMCCPVVISPTARQIAAARRAYLDWWGALLDIQSRLRSAGLTRHVVTPDMPPMRPWHERA